MTEQEKSAERAERKDDRKHATRLSGGIGLIVVAVLVCIVGGLQQFQQAQTATHDRKVAECQARFNNAYAQVTRLRGRLGDSDRAATREHEEAVSDLINKLFALKPGDAAGAIRLHNTFLKADRKYLNVENHIDDMRAAHPFPSLPSSAC